MSRDRTAAERSLAARIAAHAKHDGRESTQAARNAFQARFERDVDPEGDLPEAERLRRAEHARKACFVGLALKSAKARRKGGEAA